MALQNPPAWLDDVPPPASPEDYRAVLGLSKPKAERAASAAAPVSTKATEIYNGIARIDRILPFDRELEAWLVEREWFIRNNLLTGRTEILRGGEVVQLTDERIAEIKFSLIYSSNGKEPSKENIVDAVALIGERRAYHPVKDYFATLQWDGVPRLNSWLIDYAGATDTLLNRAFSRKMLCAAVRRIKHPGCKFDHILVMQGRQDLGKSSLIKALCTDPDWFTDQAKIGSDAKETIERTCGAWIIEFPEMDGLNRRDTNAIKSFITTTIDRARPAYGRYTVERPRNFVSFGTTNERAFLSDTTGNRRFWVVEVSKCDVGGLAAIRDQLWAEALEAEPHERLWLDSDDLKAQAMTVTETASDYGPWFEVLAGRIPDGSIKIAAVEVWRMVGIDPHSINKISVAHRANLRKSLAGLGFDPDAKNMRHNGKQVHAYVRGDPASAVWWDSLSDRTDDKPNEW